MGACRPHRVLLGLSTKRQSRINLTGFRRLSGDPLPERDPLSFMPDAGFQRHAGARRHGDERGRDGQVGCTGRDVGFPWSVLRQRNGGETPVAVEAHLEQFIKAFGSMWPPEPFQRGENSHIGHPITSCSRRVAPQRAFHI